MNTKIMPLFLGCFLLLAVSCTKESKKDAPGGSGSSDTPMVSPGMEKAPVEKAPEPMTAPVEPPVVTPPAPPEEKLPDIASLSFPKPVSNLSIALEKLQAKAVYMKIFQEVKEAGEANRKVALKPLLESMSIAARGACAFGMRAQLFEPVPQLAEASEINKEMNLGFVIHFLKGTEGSCSAENFCGISVVPGKDGKYQVMAEPLRLNIGPGPVRISSVTPFVSPGWLVQLEGQSFESAGSGYCSSSDVPDDGEEKPLVIEKHRAALLSLVAGRFRTVFSGYIGETSDSPEQGQRKNEYKNAVVLFQDKEDAGKNFYAFVQERAWFHTRVDEDRGARVTVTKNEIECKWINPEGLPVNLPADKKALLETLDPKYKECNVPGKYVQKWE